MEGLPDWRRGPSGTRVCDQPCGFDSRPFRCVCGATGSMTACEADDAGSNPVRHIAAWPLECDGQLHATLRRSQTRFDSWRGHWLRIRMEDSRPWISESRWPIFQGRLMSVGSGLRSIASSECDGSSHATPRRSQTRFDSWRGHQ